MKLYRPDVFPSVWTTLDALGRQRRLSSCDEVYRDLEKQDDELFAWAKARKSIFHVPDQRTITQVKSILATYPQYAANGGTTNRSDPWIIAHAFVVGGIVVTDEKPAPRQRATLPPKMPDVCDALGLDWIAPIDFLKRIAVRL
jgi:hypothetical protein